MIGRETLEMDAVVPQEERIIGVIGVGPGVGVTTVCRLLEREKAVKGGKSRVIDLGEASPDGIPPKKMERLLVVVDARVPGPEKLREMLERVNEIDPRVGVVLNRWKETGTEAEESRAPISDLPSSISLFRLPELLQEEIEALYNFAFYS